MIDVRTGLLLWSVEALTLSAILLVAWIHKRPAASYLWWSASLSAHGIGVALVAARGYIPAFLSIEFANALALAAYPLSMAGLRAKDGKSVLALSILPVMIWIAGMFIPAVRDNLGFRSALFSAGSAAGSIIAAACLWQPGFASIATRRKLATVFLAQATMNVVATAIMVNRPAFTLQDMANIPLTALTAAAFVVLIILFACKMIMEDSENRLKELALKDSLTGALNRRGFFEKFEPLRQTALNEKLLLSVILFDLDHFKQINDRHGHAAGDEALLAFSHLAMQRTGARGVFARLGGEEFAVILPVENAVAACAFADGIRRDLARMRIAARAHAINATVSVGVQVADAGSAHPEPMLSFADKALYAAKHAGRNRVVLAGRDEMEGENLDEKLRQLRSVLDGDTAAEPPCMRDATFKHG